MLILSASKMQVIVLFSVRLAENIQTMHCYVHNVKIKTKVNLRIK